MVYRFVTVTVADRIATITLNNPPSNVLSTAVLQELDQVFGAMEAENTVRVIIFTASGRFFCPGANISEVAKLQRADQGAELSSKGQELLNRIERLDKPVIAAINGACLGGGLELAMACWRAINPVDDISAAVSVTPIMSPVSCCGKNPFGMTMYR